METMMGTNEPYKKKSQSESDHQNFIAGRAKIRSFVTGMKFFYFHLNIQNIVDDFLTNFHVVYNKFRKIQYHRLSADKVYEHYRLRARNVVAVARSHH